MTSLKMYILLNSSVAIVGELNIHIRKLWDAPQKAPNYQN